MKKEDFNDFNASLDLSIEINSSLRRITEKIKLLDTLRDVESLRAVSRILVSANFEICNLFEHIFENGTQS